MNVGLIYSIISRQLLLNKEQNGGKNLVISKNNSLGDNIGSLYRIVETHVNNARTNVAKSINTEMLKLIG